MFAENLKNLRKVKGITQTQFAAEFNISPGTIAMWETGKRMPDSEMLKRIAQFFNVSIDYLLDNERGSPDLADEPQNEEYAILNRHAKKLTPEQQRKLIEMAKILLGEDWND